MIIMENKININKILKEFSLNSDEVGLVTNALIRKAMLEFGKQCFKAGRDKEYDKVDGDYYDKFRDFDDYLKSL